jgi:hypothetical protein
MKYRFAEFAAGLGALAKRVGLADGFGVRGLALTAGLALTSWALAVGASSPVEIASAAKPASKLRQLLFFTPSCTASSPTLDQPGW